MRSQIFDVQEMTNQKVAIITGGSSGIGSATEIGLAKEGVRVAVAARCVKDSSVPFSPMNFAAPSVISSQLEGEVVFLFNELYLYLFL